MDAKNGTGDATASNEKAPGLTLASAFERKRFMEWSRSQQPKSDDAMCTSRMEPGARLSTVTKKDTCVCAIKVRPVRCVSGGEK